MFSYWVTGIVHPERVNLNIGEALTFSINHPDFGIEGKARIEIKNSKITVEFASEIDFTKSPTCNLETLRNFIEETVRTVVDILCYVKSYNIDVEIIRLKCDGLRIDHTFDVQGEKNIYKTDEKTVDEFNKLLGLFSNKQFFFLEKCLADFRRAIKYPSETGGFCFRAIETIRKFYFENPNIIDKEQRRNEGWKELRKELNFDRDFFKDIESYAVPNRHGEYPTIPYSQRELIMNKTREVVDRFIAYITKSTPTQ